MSHETCLPKALRLPDGIKPTFGAVVRRTYEASKVLYGQIEALANDSGLPSPLIADVLYDLLANHSGFRRDDYTGYPEALTRGEYATGRAVDLRCPPHWNPGGTKCYCRADTLTLPGEQCDQCADDEADSAEHREIEAFIGSVAIQQYIEIYEQAMTHWLALQPPSDYDPFGDEARP